MQQQQETPFAKVRSSFDFIYMVTLGHATCLTPFIRNRFGVEALGWPGFIALLVQMAYALVAPSEAMAWFFVLWLVFLIHRRFTSWRRSRNGEIQHSRYAGYPWLAMKFPFVTWEKTAKGFVEPALCLLVGALILPSSQALGVFILLGVVSLTLVAGIESEINIRRSRRMNDAQIEQRMMRR